MNTEPIANHCPKCQAPLPANAPQGLCPKCLLAAAATPTEAGQPAAKDPPPRIEEVADAFPQLEILEIIGQGGMGVVFKARQPRLDRLVALKLLPQSLAADAAFTERFNREARVLARLNHPNIVTVYDFGQSGGFFFLLMEFVDGVNLRQAMQAGRFTPQQAMMLVPKICEALQFAHDEGILHRDIKPENILLDTRGRVKIADFGIAKLVGEAREKLTLTASGHAMGTPHYMAPEQLEHPQDVDQRADIYSLGVVFYEMLTGERPIGRFAPPSTKSTVDPRVDDIVFHALEKERETRVRSATEVKTSVEAITGHQKSPPSPPAPQAPHLHTTCYFNTPARMRDCFPSAAARVFTCRGELALDAEALTFTSTWRSAITIPLKGIEDLSVGQFQMWTTPWVMKYARVNFLSVTFRRDGQLQTVHLTPAEPGADNPARINDCVGRWFELLKKAVVAATGSAPHFTEPERLTVQAERAWGRKAWPLCFLFMAAWFICWFVLPGVTGFHPPRLLWPIMAIVTGLLLAATLFCSAGFIRADRALKRGDLDAVTSDDPPAPEPAAADGAGGRGNRRVILLYPILAVAVLLVSIAGWWSSRQRGGSVHSTARLTTPTSPQPPGSAATNIVLLTMPVPHTPDHAVMASQFKCLLPAHHLARVLFVRWTNGVPEVWHGLCRSFKVGVASINADFALFCWSLTGAPATNSTNEVQWTVNLFDGADHSSRFPGEPRYRAVELPTQLVVGPGRQGILRLADHLGPDGMPTAERSGIELRIFLEPLEHNPLQINPSVLEGHNYVGEVGPGWTTAEAVKAIREWPIEK